MAGTSGVMTYERRRQRAAEHEPTKRRKDEAGFDPKRDRQGAVLAPGDVIVILEDEHWPLLAQAQARLIRRFGMSWVVQLLDVCDARGWLLPPNDRTVVQSRFVQKMIRVDPAS